MPIIIWGSRGLTSNLGRGRFYCPRCEEESDYVHEQVREWFTIYFIPLFPIGGAQRYVECRQCGGTFTEEVLHLRPPTEGDRLAANLYRDMEDGESLEEIESKLRDMGVEREQARRIADDVAGDDVWTCQTCRQTYLKAVRKCRRCEAG